METPRIEKMVEEFDREYIVIKRPECNVLAFEAVAGDGNKHRLQEIKPAGVLPLTKAYERGRQAGIDEAVGMMQKNKLDLSKGGNQYGSGYNQAIDDTIKALQDNK